MLHMTALDDGVPIIGEIPKCSDTLVCSASYVGQTTCHHLHTRVS